jgi:YVTN family beta-propeller protein
MIYVTNVDSNTVSVIDGSTNKVVATIQIGNPNLADDFEFASHTAVNPKTDMIYLTNQDVNTINVIDGKTNKVLR